MNKVISPSPAEIANVEKQMATLEQQTKNSNTEYLKSKAYFCYKNKDKAMGNWYIEKAIEEAHKENKLITLEEINDIMEGKVPQTPPPMPKENQENNELAKESKQFRTKMQNLLEPLRIELEKKLGEIIKEIRSKLSMDMKEPCPEPVRSV